MKKFIQRIQSLGQKAAELKEAVQQVPPKVAGIREAVALTTGQLQQLRAQIKSSLAGLKTDHEDQLLDALREINESSGLIRQAGFALAGLDLELDPVERLIVHLERREDVRRSVLEALRDAVRARPTVHALLDALMRAEETADEVRLSGLDYRTLVIHIGPVPTVRLCWRPSRSLAQPATTSVLATAMPAPPPPATECPTFFGSTPPSAADFTAAETADEAAAARSPSTPSTASPPEPELLPGRVAAAASSGPSEKKDTPPVWNSDALQRFKTMPKASKYRR